jgi:predicted amidohydrolase YtcJ
MREAGIPLALGSDVPVDTPDPLRILHAALTRRDDAEPDGPAYLPEQALTIAQALWSYTMGAAYAGGQEARQGSIMPGKLADLVVLAEDPFTVPPERISGAQIAATFVGGELAHGELE